MTMLADIMSSPLYWVGIGGLVVVLVVLLIIKKKQAG